MVTISNLTSKEINKNFVDKICQTVLEGENKNYQEKNVHLNFVGPARMRKLNKIFRGQNRVTDVLSFEEKKFDFEKNIPSDFPQSPLGEIVICLRAVRKNAKRNSVPFDQELAKVIIHGLLHLLGYDHEKSVKEAKEMREKENYYLKSILNR